MEFYFYFSIQGPWFRIATCCLWVFYLCLSLSHGYVWPHVTLEQCVFYLCFSLSHGFIWPHVACEQRVCVLPVFEFESWFHMATCCLWPASVSFTCVWVWVMVSYGHMFPVSSECVFYLCLSLSHGFIWPHVTWEQCVFYLRLSHGFVWPHVACEQWVCVLPVFEFESWFRIATCCLWAVSVCFTCVWVWVMVSYGHVLNVSNECGFTCVWVWVMVSYSHMLPVSSECVFYMCLSLSHGFKLSQ